MWQTKYALAVPKNLGVGVNFRPCSEGLCTNHTAGLDTIFIQIYMYAPPGVPGVSKNQILFFTNKSVELLR
jgi:hypothetical protein